MYETRGVNVFFFKEVFILGGVKFLFGLKVHDLDNLRDFRFCHLPYISTFVTYFITDF